MPIRLEAKAGPVSGKVFRLTEGPVTTIGRTSRASIAIPEDTFLSSVHFAVESDGAACRVVDRKSANGTFVNGARVTEAVVRDGDEIFAGQTKFLLRVSESTRSVKRVSSGKTGQRSGLPASPVRAAVREPVERQPPLPPPVSAPPVPLVPPPPPAPSAPLVPHVSSGPAPHAAAARVALGHWTFNAVPEGWEVVEGFGIRRMGKGIFPSEAMVSEEALRSGANFEQYIAGQLDLVRMLVAQPQIEPAGPAPIASVDEGRAFVVRYRTDDGRRFFQRQIYVRKGQRAGALALTTLESEMGSLEAVFNQIISGLRFDP